MPSSYDRVSKNYRQSELDKFAAFTSGWWDPHGPQKPLHALNPVRLDYISKRVSLSGARVLDVGCGGGLLSEALARQGAHVTAIDLAPELIKAARLHGLESGSRSTTASRPLKTCLLNNRPRLMPSPAWKCLSMSLIRRRLWTPAPTS